MFIILTLELIEVGAVTTALSFVHTAVSLLLHRWFPSYRGQNVSCCPSFWNNDPLNSFGDELLSGSVNFFFYLFVSFFFFDYYYFFGCHDTALGKVFDPSVAFHLGDRFYFLFAECGQCYQISIRRLLFWLSTKAVWNIWRVMPMLWDAEFVCSNLSFFLLFFFFLSWKLFYYIEHSESQQFRLSLLHSRSPPTSILHMKLLFFFSFLSFFNVIFSFVKLFFFWNFLFLLFYSLFLFLFFFVSKLCSVSLP